MVLIDFGGQKENVVTREEFPLDYAGKVLRDSKIATLGYGIQGRGQSLNLRDNSFQVYVGQRPGRSYDKALADGWVPGESLFSADEAAEKADIVQFLFTDADQKEYWPRLRELLKPGNMLVFSHGFGIVYKDQTGIVPPKDVDVVLVAPKGSGLSVRRNFLAKEGINSSYAVWQDATGHAEEKVKALGIGIGSGYLFPTTFENEVHSDLTGERGVLMGALAGIMEAQYDTLRQHGHSPSEAFNETVEELTESLIKLVSEKGMDWMYNNCSETARIGALRWGPRFRDTVRPLFDALYESVVSGEETRIVLARSKEPDFKAGLDAELYRMGNSEMWRTGATVRSLRPDTEKK